MTQSIDFKNMSAGKKMATKGTFERNGLPAVNRSTTGSEFGKVRTYKPQNYYNYTHRDQTSETSSQVKRDALGQRVRDRFNEDLSKEDFNKRPGSKHMKLNSKILSACDQ